MANTLTQPAVDTKAGVRLRAQSNGLARGALLASLLLAIWLGIWPLLATPAALPVDAPAGAFSAGRALQDLAVVAAEPHPIGSPRNAAVRDYLVAQIEALGLAPELQQATLTRARPERGMATITAVENILVRVPGTDSSGAIVVTGHYDSVPTSGGAADCGGCVVTVLETLRALQSGPALKNDVIFLFTDGEEVGVTGARGFVMDHPWAQDVAFYIVFEGYGTGGASMLYVTSPDSGELVAEALRAGTMPTGYSFLHNIMWALAGNTGSDLDAVVAAGKPGLAFINLSVGGAPAYHVMADAPDYLNPGSLQHHGEHALGIVRQLGNAELGALAPAPDVVYFNVLPGVVVQYPGALALPFAVLAALLYGVVLVMALRRRTATLGGVVLGALALLLSLVTAVAAVTLAWWLLRLANPNWHIVLLGGWYWRAVVLRRFPGPGAGDHGGLLPAAAALVQPGRADAGRAGVVERAVPAHGAHADRLQPHLYVAAAGHAARRGVGALAAGGGPAAVAAHGRAGAGWDRDDGAGGALHLRAGGLRRAHGGDPGAAGRRAADPAGGAGHGAAAAADRLPGGWQEPRRGEGRGARGEFGKAEFCRWRRRRRGARGEGLGVAGGGAGGERAVPGHGGAAIGL